jgi:hypothetical protein
MVFGIAVYYKKVIDIHPLIVVILKPDFTEVPPVFALFILYSLNNNIFTLDLLDKKVP